MIRTDINFDPYFVSQFLPMENEPAVWGVFGTEEDFIESWPTEEQATYRAWMMCNVPEGDPLATIDELMPKSNWEIAWAGPTRCAIREKGTRRIRLFCNGKKVEGYTTELAQFLFHGEEAYDAGR